MATGSFILRPNKDISFNHVTNGKKGFQSIREKVADDNATYIYQTVDTTSQIEVVSVFGVNIDGNIPKENFTITRIKKVIRLCSTQSIIGNANIGIGLSQIKGNQESLNTSYTDKISDAQQSEIDKINLKIKETGNFPTSLLKATIYTAGRKNGYKDSSSEIRVTQVYFEVFYNTIEKVSDSFYIKEGSNWNKYNKVYKKNNGVWVEDSFKNIFGNMKNNTNTIYVKGIN